MSGSDEAWFPVLEVVCPSCFKDVPVPPGLNALDAAWLHEHDCPAYVAPVEFVGRG